MMNMKQILNAFQEIVTFLKANIQSEKCMLVIGPQGSGKTCLLKYWSGSIFRADINEDDLPCLVQQSSPEGDTKPVSYINQKISLKLTVLNIVQENSQKLTILEMPSFFSLQGANSQQTPQQRLCKILSNIFIWNIIINSIPHLHMCLISPFEFITDNHKLIQFFKTWEKIAINSQQQRQKLRQCMSIVFTKPEYQEDKQQLITSLNHLSQDSDAEIPNFNTFQQAIQSDRVFCFLSQDSIEGAGPEMIQLIVENAKFYNTDEHQVFENNWKDIFVKSSLENQQLYKSQQIILYLNQIYKEFLGQEESKSKIFNQCLSFLGILWNIKFLECLSSQNSFKNIQKQLQSQIMQKLKQERIILKDIIKEDKTEKNALQMLRILKKFTDLIIQGIKGGISFGKIKYGLLTEILQKYTSIDIEKNKMKKWIEKEIWIWDFIDSFTNSLKKFESDNQIQSNIHVLEDLSKQISKHFSILARTKSSNNIRKLQIFNKISQVKSLSQSAQFKELLPQYQAGEDEQEQVQQQNSNLSSDTRIKRWYFSNQKSEDYIFNLKDKAKKIILKNIQKNENNNQRQIMKNLLNSIEREPENKIANLQILAKKMQRNGLYKDALSVLMNLYNPDLLQTFLIEQFFPYLERSGNSQAYKFLSHKLIPYLEQKSAIYADYQKALKYLNCLENCYDFLAASTAQTSQDFSGLIMLPNQIQKPTQEECIFSNQGQQSQSINDTNQYFLQYSELSKAQFIEKHNERDQKLKKNEQLFGQIRKYLAVLRQQVEIK